MTAHAALAVPVESACPCCGAPMLAPAADVLRRTLTPTEAEVWDMLHARAGRYVTNDALVRHVYRRDPSGGPDSGPNVVRAMVMTLRKKIEPHGLGIASGWGRGWALVVLKREDA